MEHSDEDILNHYNSIAVKPYIGANILLGIFMVLGILGNLHVLYVYRYRMKVTSHRVFIIVLAVLDLLSCSVSIPFITADMMLRLKFTATTGCKILRFFLYFFAGSSGFLLLPIAVDRYLKTCRPFGVQITPYRAKLLCALTLSVSVASFWPAPVLYGHDTIVISGQNFSGVSCYLDDSFKETLYLAYWNILITVMISIVFFCLISLYYLINKRIKLHAALRSKLLDQDKANKVTNEAQSRQRRHLSPNERMQSENSYKHYGRSCRQGDKNNKMNVYTVYNDQFETNASSYETSEVDDNVDAKKERKVTVDGVKSIEIDVADTNVADEVTQNKNDIITDDGKTATEDEDAKEAFKSNVEEFKKTFDYIQNECSNDIDKDKLSNDMETVASEEKPNSNGVFRKEREALRHLKRTNRTTQMFFALTILYFLTFIPHLIVQLLTTTQENFVEDLSFAWQTVYHSVFNFAFLNSMVNCYVYGFFDSLFRNELKSIYVGKCCVGRNEQAVDSHSA